MVESKFLSSSRLNQKGQGMIEYILLLFITVTMILLAMANLFKPMQNFLKNFMGTYVACLLTSGELPAIRVENKMKDTEAKCSFSMTGGNKAQQGDQVLTAATVQMATAAIKALKVTRQKGITLTVVVQAMVAA